ncbi:hypothetical protein KP509_01G122700 [Ceratopteris richardii]|nr:hypothetical protein KP509_01G122700 [Ceratopteris richardii]
MAQGLSVSLDYPTDRYRCSVDFKLWRFWKRQGSKMISMGNRRVEVFWDLSSAKYENGPEPQQNFFLVVACSDQIILLLGDLKNEAMKKFQAQEPLAEVTLLSRKEHVYGKELYATRVQFHEKGPTHDVVIECHVQPLKAEPMLLFHVDNREVIRVTGLMWKFRGNQTVEIDGVAVQVFWDVHNWLFKAPEAHAVFMFNTSMADEKPQKPTEGIISGWIQAPSHLPYHVSTLTKKPHSVSDGIWASVLQWPTDAIFKHGEQTFSIILYAWNYE